MPSIPFNYNINKEHFNTNKAANYLRLVSQSTKPKFNRFTQDSEKSQKLVENAIREFVFDQKSNKKAFSDLSSSKEIDSGKENIKGKQIWSIENFADDEDTQTHSNKKTFSLQTNTTDSQNISSKSEDEISQISFSNFDSNSASQHSSTSTTDFTPKPSELDDQRQRIIVFLLEKVCALIDRTPTTFVENCLKMFEFGILTDISFLLNTKNKHIQSLIENQKKRFENNEKRLFSTKSFLIQKQEPGSLAGTNSSDSTLTRFDRDFERLEILGKGSFGRVWKCRHRIDHNLYAVKEICFGNTSSSVLNLNYFDFENLAKRKILREVRCISKFNHKNVCRYYGSQIEESKTNILPTNKFLISSTVSHNSCKNSSSEFSSDIDNSNIDSDESFSSTGTNHSTTQSQQNDVERLDYKNKMMTPYIKNENNVGRISPIVFSTKPRLYIQIELCSPFTIRTQLNQRNFSKKKCVNELQNMCIFYQILDGLNHIHQNGIIHRDIKPENLFLAISGNEQKEENIEKLDFKADFDNETEFMKYDLVKIGDFGLSKDFSNKYYFNNKETNHKNFENSNNSLVNQHSTKPRLRSNSEPKLERRLINTVGFIDDQRRTQELNLILQHNYNKNTLGVGTTIYTSPEQLKGTLYCTKSDIYSCAIVLFEMFSNFSTEMERVKLIDELRQSDGKSLSEDFKKQQPNIAYLIQQMMSPLPLNRPSAAQLLSFEYVARFYSIASHKGLFLNQHESVYVNKVSEINGCLIKGNNRKSNTNLIEQILIQQAQIIGRQKKQIEELEKRLFI